MSTNCSTTALGGICAAGVPSNTPWLMAKAKSMPKNAWAAIWGFIAICQGGYPEARQSEAALAVCRQFACEAGFEWVGGLAFGGGSVIGGQPLESMGVLTKYPRQALDMTAEAIARGQPVPDEAVEAMAKLLLPTWLIPPILNAVMLLRLYQAGVLKSFRARPFAE
jgi:hypothetical protein